MFGDRPNSLLAESNSSMIVEMLATTLIIGLGKILGCSGKRNSAIARVKRCPECRTVGSCWMMSCQAAHGFARESGPETERGVTVSAPTEGQSSGLQNAT
jgi:hypothetical protein